MPRFVVPVALVATLLAVGCANQKEPATRALEAVDTQLNALREDAAKYAPEALASAEATLGKLHSAFDNGDYSGVLTAVPDVTKSVAALKDTAAAKKAEALAAIEQAKTQWATLGVELPKQVEALKSRIAALSQSKSAQAKLGPGVFDSAKTGLEEIERDWTSALGTFNAGDQAEAVGKAEALRTKIADIAKQIGATIA